MYNSCTHIFKYCQVVESAVLLTNREVINQFIGDLVNAMRDYQKADSIQLDYSLPHFNNWKCSLLAEKLQTGQIQSESIVINNNHAQFLGANCSTLMNFPKLIKGIEQPLLGVPMF